MQTTSKPIHITKEIRDIEGKLLYRKWSDGYTEDYKIDEFNYYHGSPPVIKKSNNLKDENGNQVAYLEYAHGYWERYTYDKDGKVIDMKNSYRDEITNKQEYHNNQVTLSKSELKQLVQNHKFEYCVIQNDLKMLSLPMPEKGKYKNLSYTKILYIVPELWLRDAIERLFNVDDIDYWDCNSNIQERQQLFIQAIAERRIIMVNFE